MTPREMDSMFTVIEYLKYFESIDFVSSIQFTMFQTFLIIAIDTSICYQTDRPITLITHRVVS